MRADMSSGADGSAAQFVTSAGSRAATFGIIFIVSYFLRPPISYRTGTCVALTSLHLTASAPNVLAKRRQRKKHRYPAGTETQGNSNACNEGGTIQWV